jgi:hypothetical protein
MASYFLGIDIRVRMESRKASVKKKVVHFGILNSRSFLKTIKRFLKVTNKARFILDISKRFSIYIYSCKSPCKKEDLTSIWWTSQLCEASRARTRQMEFILSTGAKVSL